MTLSTVISQAKTSSEERAYRAGSCLLAGGFAEEAEEFLAKADQSHPGVLLNRGVGMRLMNRFAEAHGFLTQSLEIDPSAAALTNLGSVYEDLGAYTKATDLHAKAADAAPDEDRIALNYAMCLMREKRFKEAWPYWERGRRANDYAYPNLPRWKKGLPLAGKKVLVCREGGFGDVFLYMRWFKSLKDLGASIHFWVWDSVIPLLQGHRWIDQFLTASEPIELWDEGHLKYDYCLPLMSLPSALELDGEIAEPLDYLIDHNQTLAALCNINAHLSKRKLRERTVGFCWQAEENTVTRKHRSLNFDDFSKIADLLPLTLLLVPGHSIKHEDDWLHTAQYISRCDLVISVDTAVAHLAGAMGKPVWILLPLRRDQKWGLPESPANWYPKARLFQQTDPVKWDNVVEEIGAALCAL